MFDFSVTESKRIQDWLSRCAEDVGAMASLDGGNRLAAVRQSYAVLAVLEGVAAGQLQMQGITPVKT